MSRRLARLSYPQLVDALARLTESRSRADQFRARVWRRKLRREIAARERVAIIASDLLGEPID